jgi:hypothetical protein
VPVFRTVIVPCAGKACRSVSEAVTRPPVEGVCAGGAADVDRDQVRSAVELDEVVGSWADGDGEAGGPAGEDVDAAEERRFGEDPAQGGVGGGSVAVGACAVCDEAGVAVAGTEAQERHFLVGCACDGVDADGTLPPLLGPVDGHPRAAEAHLDLRQCCRAPAYGGDGAAGGDGGDERERGDSER